MKRIILDYTVVRELDLAVAFLRTYCKGSLSFCVLCQVTNSDKESLKNKPKTSKKPNPKQTMHLLRTIKFQEKTPNTLKCLVSELGNVHWLKKIILTAPQCPINHSLLTIETHRQTQKWNRKAGEMKCSFVLRLNLSPLPGHKQFIWAEKPTGPLGILQLLACVKQGGTWSGTDLLDVLSHKVPCFAGGKTVWQKDLFHRAHKLFHGT